MNKHEPKQRRDDAEDEETPRLDKWLWAARFFKTRSAAQEAIQGGKVHLDGSRVKPSKPVSKGQTLEIVAPHGEFTVVVEALSSRRGPATVAAALYKETPESIARRTLSKTDRVLQGDQSSSRPDKKQRRQLRTLLDRE